ncbi:hypothetical protein MMC25_008002 [Agyrium rufum]|nr:hypothetical protein [Agyrium rufum]
MAFEKAKMTQRDAITYRIDTFPDFTTLSQSTAESTALHELLVLATDAVDVGLDQRS